ncbi:uncharacterized protein LOC119722878 [Patiria miniata]|uniref:Uncharacterized protein n=1 Tax=Patiria miniata TaxID=46514 RepID=A0A913ZDL8_PATMI|nr:uncharacterized protein LOC119722851 [Patiria miniata]XP_038049161.1 uncharacterized protein LOC119722851 [Patiria miniata]XP_038049207.1 uncharacterized protein LOC119722878 [Patiria miniata]
MYTETWIEPDEVIELNLEGFKFYHQIRGGALPDDDVITLFLSGTLHCYTSSRSSEEDNHQVPSTNDAEEPAPTYDKVFDVFCGTVLAQRSSMEMTDLLKCFIDIARTSENKDASRYRMLYLKRRLKEKYPQLQSAQLASVSSLTNLMLHHPLNSCGHQVLNQILHHSVRSFHQSSRHRPLISSLTSTSRTYLQRLCVRN